MSNFADMVAELTQLAQIESSENFDETVLEGYIQSALAQHNKALTITSLPIEQEEPVLTLAWIKVCLVRAAKAAKDSSLGGASGYSKDANSPYQKNMDMAKQLWGRYQELCTNLQIDKDSVVVGQVFVRDHLFDAMVPLFQNRKGIEINLVCDKASGSDVILRWSINDISDLNKLLLYSIEGSDPIYQEWNAYSATNTANINDSAVLVQQIFDTTITSLKITDVDLSKLNRFLLVARTNSYKYQYSNELVVNGITDTTVDNMTGSVSIPQNATEVVVTGLALPNLPAKVLVQVTKPAGQTNIFATPVQGTLSTDGFTVDLSQAPTVSGYQLEWVITF
jgi:hypothetical protein